LLKLYFLVFFFYKVRSSVMCARNFSKSFDVWWKKLFMNECMYAWLCRKHGEVKVHNVGVEGNNTIWWGLWFHLYLYHGFYQVPKVQPPLNFIGWRDNTRSNNVRRKVLFECSIACRLFPRQHLVSHCTTSYKGQDGLKVTKGP